MLLRTLALFASLLTLTPARAETITYDYDPNGNLLIRQTPTQTDTAGFDALDRQTLDTAGDGLLRQFEYDPNGNRTQYQVDTFSETLAYVPQSNRLIQRGSQPITLDAQGRVTNDGQYQYVYNSAGRLTQISQGASEIARYHYNHLGQRTRKTTAQGITLYHHDLAGHLLLETTASGQTIRRYFWSDDQPIAQIDTHPTTGAETITYLHTDHLNTPRRGSDAQGRVVWTWDSDAFGSLLPNEDADGDGQNTVVNLRHSRGYFHAESGLIRIGERDYNPRLGRWLTADSMSVAQHVQRYRANLGAPGQPPLEINPFAFVANNPLRWTDPTGLAICAPDEYAIPNPPSETCPRCSTGYTCVPRNPDPDAPVGNRCMTAACAAGLPHSPTADTRSAAKVEQDSCEFVCGLVWLGPLLPLSRAELIPWVGGQVSSYLGCKWICKDKCPAE